MTIKTVYIPAGGGFDHVTIATSPSPSPSPSAAAFRRQESGQHFGKIVVDI